MIHPTPTTAETIQFAISKEIEAALRLMSPGYFRNGRGQNPCYVSPNGQMSWRDQSGRQVVVTIQVATL